MNILLENEWSNQEIKDENENVSPNLWNVAKAILRGKYIAIQAYLKKQEVSNTQPNPKPNRLEKEQQTKPKAYRRREKKKMREEIKNAEKTKQENGITKLRAGSS